MRISKARLFIGVIAVAALFAGSASATPGGRTGGTGSQTNCRSTNGNVVGVVTSYSPTYLWPPNHKQTPVTINYTDRDDDGDNISVAITHIQHDQAQADGSEEIQGSGPPDEGVDYTVGPDSTATGTDGTTVPDLVIHGAIRSERSGTVKAGRTYTITVTCT
ncbi:MAG: hypothetical protein ABR548_06365, partial [Actinomycetota bacterium]